MRALFRYRLFFNKLPHRYWEEIGESQASIRDFVILVIVMILESTNDIIKNINLLTDKVIFTIHPERWTNEPIEWINSLITQKLKKFCKISLLKNKLL